MSTNLVSSVWRLFRSSTSKFFRRAGEANRFRNLEKFAKGNPAFIDAMRRKVPACKPNNAGELLINEINEFVASLDYDGLVSLLDRLREFLNIDGSPQAKKFWKALVTDSRLITEERLASGSMNSLWGVTPIINLKAGVAADCALGINSKSLVFTTYHISSDFDYVLSSIGTRLVDEKGQDWILLRWVMLIWAIVNFDCLHLYNDRGIIEPAGGYGSPNFGISVTEMKIYGEAGKRLYTYAYGADHRLRQKTLALGKWTFCSECPDPGTFCVCDDIGGSEMLRVIREHSTAVIAHGLSMKIIPGARNIPYIALDVEKMRPTAGPAVKGEKLTVGHFPNHGYFKGSKYLEAAIRKLQQEGLEIELLQLTGKPNSEIIEAMGEIDVLVDQLVSGSFGLTAIEAMAVGCPVVCYLHADVDIAEPEACPIIQANPDTIEDVLRALTFNRERLLEARVAGPHYVRRNYSVRSLARHLGSLYLQTGGLPGPLMTKIADKVRHLNS